MTERYKSTLGHIGNTPLIRLNQVSDATGCEILGKAEFMNPGGWIKDRAALGIVRSHGGRIRVSTGAEGSRVRILLPPTTQVEEAAGPESTDASEEDDWQGEGVVLVADDEETVRILASAVARKLGLEVLLAEDGSRAVEVFRAAADRVRVVLLDMTMPELSGPESFRAIREIRADVPVILMSGHADPATLAELFAEGLHGFVEKPFHPRRLRDQLRSGLRAAGP